MYCAGSFNVSTFFANILGDSVWPQSEHIHHDHGDLRPRTGQGQEAAETHTHSHTLTLTHTHTHTYTHTHTVKAQRREQSVFVYFSSSTRALATIHIEPKISSVSGINSVSMTPCVASCTCSPASSIYESSGVPRSAARGWRWRKLYKPCLSLLLRTPSRVSFARVHRGGPQLLLRGSSSQRSRRFTYSSVLSRHQSSHMILLLRRSSNLRVDAVTCM